MAFNIFQAQRQLADDNQTAFDGGYARTGKVFSDVARRKAGAALATGDRAGAAQALGGEGDVAGVRQIQADQAGADQLARNNTRQDSLDAQDTQDHGAKALLEAIDHVAALPEAERPAAMQHPVWQALGVTKEMLAKMTPADLSDTSIAQFKQKVAAATHVVNPGAHLVDNSGNELFSAPFEPKYHTVGEGQKLVETGGDAPASGSAPNVSEGLKAMEGIGAKVTSGYRSAEHNAAVGGVPNSRHLTGEAVDLVPPANMTMAQLAGEAQRRFPGSKIINEGDHVHVQWGGQQAPARARVVAEGAPKADEDSPLSPDTVQLLAGKYLNSGTLPPMGAGKTGTRNRAQILNAATTQAKALGLDANDLVAGTVSVKAAGSALNKAVTLRAMTEGFEQTALKNASLMLSLAPKGGGQTNAPVLNRWLQAGRKQIAGDSDVSSFDVALGTFSDEYAKIMSGSAGGAPVSDASRREAYDRLSKYATQGQLKAGVDVMRKEMANRIGSMQDVEAGLRDTIRRGGQPSGLGSAPNIYAQPAAPGSPTPARSPPMMRYDVNGRLIK